MNARFAGCKPRPAATWNSAGEEAVASPSFASRSTDRLPDLAHGPKLLEKVLGNGPPPLLDDLLPRRPTDEDDLMAGGLGVVKGLNQYRPPAPQPQGYARVGANTLASQAAARSAARGSSGGSAAVIPPSYYSPKWSEQLDAGKRSTEHEIDELETKGTRGASDYGIGLSELEHQKANALANLNTTRGRQEQDKQRMLAQLADSYKRLGVKQTEGANTAGVLYGGAVLQSAAKRAANEGVQKAGTEQTFQRQLQDDATREAQINEGNENSAGHLTLSHQREGENINKYEIPYAKENILSFEEGIGREEAKEAADNDYAPPHHAAAPYKPNPAQLRRIKSGRL
jgi:hypothetical protein